MQGFLNFFKEPTITNALLSKKHRYLVFSVAVFSLIYLYSEAVLRISMGLSLLVVLVTLLGSIAVQYPNIAKQNIPYILLMPYHFIAGILLSIHLFPNLALPIKFVLFFAVGVLSYILSLMTNIFLVVHERQKLVPLYRVANTWAQILVVIVAIPYFTGIFKLEFNPLLQNFIVALSGFSFVLYMFWTQRYDPDSIDISLVEQVVDSLQVATGMFFAGLAVAFLPTESFLRGVFVAAVLMAGYGYMESHYKNSITRKLVVQYSLIVLLFLVILLISQN
ncbi:hypothetical protein KC980_00390 [candidate division WWE3 bacterium]|uniref:Uncharacterized protein n=1 Tax=candidate division WWE3 bacterium TaxID=2053526 RepID=A0A955EC24_UNCKA|nr:hypothetical protein [candidate division WWE3 bacterium]